ncbi:Uncharacterised protein [Campylobacter hyointestinalis subsp. hyointestinalis]|uniref:Uncharacterized protein n=1 Tax=Campylobacter hyointestinalis subsp. hyointestinalis TaxID=91352 RepID=A0A9W5EZ85_CAMHY|nr:hypothetical protein [Campylobacter hyointestinalis]CUU76948.1 Uncharacterised protein [Campylobacter hyointestinalis subsp. hyointestinalis]
MKEVCKVVSANLYDKVAPVFKGYSKNPLERIGKNMLLYPLGLDNILDTCDFKFDGNDDERIEKIVQLKVNRLRYELCKLKINKKHILLILKDKQKKYLKSEQKRYRAELEFRQSFK